MKKVKYLFGLLILGLGLLFNQSFGIDVELIDLGQSQYLVEFPERHNGDGWGYTNDYYMYYNLSYNNGYNKINIQPYYLGNECGCSSCTSYQFNNSITGFDLYNSSTYSYASCTKRPYNYRFTRGLNFYDNNLYQIVLGSQNSINHGQAFVCVDCFNTVISQNPKFGLGSDFILTNSYKLVGSKESSYFRLYNEFNTGFDVNSVDFNTLSGGGFPFDSWEYFTNRQTWTSYGRIANQGYAFSYIGSYRGIGYSYIYSRDLNNSGTVSWNNLQFRTMYDQVVAPLKLMAANNQWILLDSDLSGFYYDGVLVLPLYSYYSGSSLGQYLIAKDFSNPQRVLYELYSCNNNNVESVWSGGGTEFCAKLDAGYLTYDGSTNVLPFMDYTQEFSVNYSPEFYPLLTDLTQNLRLSTEQVSAGFKIGNHVYGFESDPTVDIQKSLSYFNNDPLVNSTTNQELMENLCKTNVEFYTENLSFCAQYGWNFGTIDMGNSNYVLTTVCVDSGDQKICYDKLIPAGITGDIYVDSDGNTYYISDNPYVSMLGTTGSVSYVSGYLDSDGLLSGSYFSDYFSSPRGKLFSCPYPQVSTFDFITKIKIGKFYPLMPINCFVSAFRAGNTVHYFDDFGVFPTSYGSGLLYGNTKYHTYLFRFFDILLSFGIFILLSSLVRLFSK